MTDDRTEEALRRALHDAARQVNVPMGSLPTRRPSRRSFARRRADLRVPALVMLVLVLVAGSIALDRARGGDGPASIATFGAGAEPITGENADIEVVMSVRRDRRRRSRRSVSFAEESPEIAAFTFLSPDELATSSSERSSPASPISAELRSTSQFSPVFRLRVGSRRADRGRPRSSSRRSLVWTMRSSTGEDRSGLAPPAARHTGPSTGGAPSPTVVLPSTTAVPAAAEPTTVARRTTRRPTTPSPTTVPASDRRPLPRRRRPLPHPKEIPLRRSRAGRLHRDDRWAMSCKPFRTR